MEILTSKYLTNYKNIILPFKNALPLKKFDKNPILGEGKPKEWDGAGIWQPYLFYDGKKYFLYYESYPLGQKLEWQIGVATAEKITGPWKKHPENPILKYTKKSGDFDKQCIADPCVLHYNGKYHMFFDMYDGKIWRLGKAYSDDGIHWEKLKKNGKTSIILDVGRKNQWDGKMVHCPEVYEWNNKLHIMYGAQGIGHLDYDTGLAIQKDKNGELFYKWGQVTTDEMLGEKIIVSRLQAGIILNGIIIAGLRVKKLKNYETNYMVFSDDGGKSWNKLTESIINPGSEDSWDYKLFYGPNTWLISENKLWTAYLGGKEYAPRRLGLAFMNIPNIK
ncbi:MAG: family 43 glycosylhydrolase [Promethearchaeota archaeon]